MGDDLMAEKVEVDPLVGTAPLRTTEQFAIESPCRGKIVDREGQVEWRKAHVPPLLKTAAIVETFVDAK
jgi:hypothetical protein